MRGHGVALKARAQRCELCWGWVGGDEVCSPHCAAPQDPASAPDPGQPALAPRPGRAKLGWAGIDRRSDKSIDFCAEKLIDLLLAPRTREPPSGGAGDPSVQGAAQPESPGSLAPARRQIPSPPHRGSQTEERGEKRVRVQGLLKRGGQTRPARYLRGKPSEGRVLSRAPAQTVSQSPPPSPQRQTDQPVFRKRRTEAGPHGVTLLSTRILARAQGLGQKGASRPKVNVTASWEIVSCSERRMAGFFRRRVSFLPGFKLTGSRLTAVTPQVSRHWVAEPRTTPPRGTRRFWRLQPAGCAAPLGRNVQGRRRWGTTPAASGLGGARFLVCQPSVFWPYFPNRPVSPPSVVRLNILAWQEGRREPRGPREPIRLGWVGWGGEAATGRGLCVQLGETPRPRGQLALGSRARPWGSGETLPGEPRPPRDPLLPVPCSLGFYSAFRVDWPPAPPLALNLM